MSSNLLVKFESKIAQTSHLNVPEALSSPWFHVDLCIVISVIPKNLLCIPLKMPYDLWVNKVVYDPVPEWTTPGLICFFLALKFEINIMRLKLNAG